MVAIAPTASAAAAAVAASRRRNTTNGIASPRAHRVRSSTTVNTTVPLVAPIPKRASFIHRPKAVRPTAVAAAAQPPSRPATPRAQLAASFTGVRLRTPPPPQATPPVVEPPVVPEEVHSPAVQADQSADLRSLLAMYGCPSPALPAATPMAFHPPTRPSNPVPTAQAARTPTSHAPFPQGWPASLATPPPKDNGASYSPIPRSCTRNPLAASLAPRAATPTVPSQSLGLDLGYDTAPWARLDSVRA